MEGWMDGGPTETLDTPYKGIAVCGDSPWSDT